MRTPERIAVIGLGKMGGGLARNLAARFDVTVFDLDAAAIERCVAAGATAAESAVAAADGVDLIVSSLPMPAHVVALYDELAPRLGSRDDGGGSPIVMDTSTIDPDTASRVADTVGRDRYVACLLGKGPAQAETGEVPLFVGGPDDVLDALGPVFDCIGAGVHRLGTVEAATAFKLVSNLIGMTNLAVLAEGYTLCRRAGVDDDAFTAALADTGGWSYQAEVRLPWMIAGDFEPRFSVALGRKDLALTVAMAARRDIATPVGAAGMSQLASAAAHGYGDDDVAAVLKITDPAR
ncbi:MAG: NAD(P)-dependent oxidoreductase [Actinomycetota bacterium]